MKKPFKLSSTQIRNDEVFCKLSCLRELMKKHQLQGLRLRGVDWFSWITAGGNSWVILTNEVGVAEVLVTQESAWVLTNVIESKRIREEELPTAFEIFESPWQNVESLDSTIEKILSLDEFVQQKTFNGKTASDRPQNFETSLPLDFQLAKMTLLESEIIRYRQIGKDSAEAMTAAMTAALPSWSELELAAEGARQLIQRGLEPTLILVSGYERGHKHRHPLPQNSKLGPMAMMVFCARKEGLYANLTRFLSFQEIPAEIKNRFSLLQQIEAQALSHTRTGHTLHSVYEVLANAYTQAGLPKEINNHHQGGITGYLSREKVAAVDTIPTDDGVVLRAGMAFAWNPSLPGAKIEDTVLLTNSATQHLENLTYDPAWPCEFVNGLPRPQVWVRQLEFTASAYGRVNLIGEHTDYNGGWVLPTAIPQKTTVRLKRRLDRTVKATTTLKSQRQLETLSASYQLSEETPGHSWMDYIQGVTYLLAKQGYPLTGFEIQIESTVPVGSGLSSSAALEISLLKAIRMAFADDFKKAGVAELTEIEMAKIGQKLENEFVGAHVGIMDQMACSLAQFGEALFLDTYQLTYERIEIPMNELDLIVINSGVTHQHSNGDYNQRRAECEETCALLKIHHLRDLSEKDLGKLEVLPEVLKRRARHVVTENARVHKAVVAMKNKDFKTLGRLFHESHVSMRDDYQVSVPAVDVLVELCELQSDVYGARLTGGGFGGSIVALAKKGCGADVAHKVVTEYKAKMNLQPTILV